MPSRNPNWTDEELVLGLSVYKRIGIGSLSKERPEILELSELLNRLPIHPKADPSQSKVAPSHFATPRALRGD
jgi:hypothetical protein